MSAVASAPRSVRLALELIGLLDEAIEAAGRLEEAAYEEAEFGFVFVARGVRERLVEGREALDKLVRSRASGGLGLG